MTLAALPQAAALWLALGATTVAALLPRWSRFAWWVASLMLLAWLALAGWPVQALVLAGAATVAMAIDAGDPDLPAGFGGVIRAIMALVAAYVGAALVLVRLVHAELALAYMAFPAMAAALLAAAVLANARGEPELLRASRMLVVLAAVAATAAGGQQPALVVVLVAAWLPLMAGIDRVWPIRLPR